MKRYAVIPTRDRPHKYAKCFRSICDQVDAVVTVAHHGPEYAVEGTRAVVVDYREEPPNISRMWNRGLARAAELAGDERYLVAILNDDIEVCAFWFDMIERAMEHDQTVLGSGPGPSHEMILGAAFVLRGGTILADEAWGWWGSDNYIHEQAVENWGGWSRVPRAQTWHDREDLHPGPLLTSAQQDLARWREHMAARGVEI